MPSAVNTLPHPVFRPSGSSPGVYSPAVWYNLHKISHEDITSATEVWRVKEMNIVHTFPRSLSPMCMCVRAPARARACVFVCVRVCVREREREREREMLVITTEQRQSVPNES